MNPQNLFRRSKKQIREDLESGILAARDRTPENCQFQPGSKSLCAGDAWQLWGEEFAEGLVRDPDKFLDWCREKNVCAECSPGFWGEEPPAGIPEG